MLTCRLGRYDHIGIEAMLYQRALEDRIRRYEGVTIARKLQGLLLLVLLYKVVPHDTTTLC